MKKIAIFGGSFNPPHLGHINSVKHLKDRLGFQKIFVIPSYQNPLKKMVEGPSPEHRLAMTELAFAELGPGVEVLSLEISAAKVSYTVETLKKLKKAHPDARFSLILGMDLLGQFNQWRKWEEILNEVSLVVTSRPGFDFPSGIEEMPEFLRPLSKEFEFNIAQLNNGNEIQFVQLPDLEVSGTEIRKKLILGQKVETLLPLSVENFIREKGLYKPLREKIKDYKVFTEFCSRQLFSRKAINVRGFDLTALSAPTDFALICSGTSTRHAASLAENLLVAVKQEFGLLPQAVEGLSEGRWVVIDYGALMVHVFYDFVRNEYSIEKLWSEGKDLGLKDPDLKTTGAPSP